MTHVYVKSTARRRMTLFWAMVFLFAWVGTDGLMLAALLTLGSLALVSAVDDCTLEQSTQLEKSARRRAVHLVKRDDHTAVRTLGPQRGRWLCKSLFGVTPLRARQNVTPYNARDQTGLGKHLQQHRSGATIIFYHARDRPEYVT